MQPLIVHIGFRKTASTMLQKFVYPEISGLEFVWPYDRHFIYDALSLIEFPGGEGERRACFQEFSSYCRKSEKPILLSRESFIMPGNSLKLASYKPLKIREPDVILSDLWKLHGNVRILLFIRRQEDWLESWYQERIKRYETRRYSKMLRGADFEPMLRMLNYDQVIENLQSRFGAKSVFVIPFEFLKSDPYKFYQLLGTSLGLKVPVMHPPIVKGRIKPRTLMARRVSNKVLVRIARFTGGNTEFDGFLFRAMKRIYSYDFIFRDAGEKGYDFGKIDEKTSKMYVGSNKRTSNLIGIDLGSLGYL